MKNLNSTTKTALMPKQSSVTSVSRKFLCSLCAALMLLTYSFSAKAQAGTGTGTPSSLYVLPTFGFSGSNITYVQDAQCTSCSPITNNYGDPYSSGPDKWIQLNIADAGYLSIVGGTADFDSVFYLFDSSWNLVASADDGYGSSDNVGHSYLQPGITYFYASVGTYYLIVDGSTKYTSSPGTSWTVPKGTVNVDFRLD